MKSTLLEQTVSGVLDEALAAATDGVIFVAPDAEMLEGLIESIGSETPSIRLLADSDSLRDVMDDFLLASRAADHVEAGTLEIRRYDEGTNALLITDEAVVSVVCGDGCAAGLTADDASFLEAVHGRFSEAWDGAETYSLRSPSLNRVRETLTAELGEATAADFDAILSSLRAARGDGEGLDEITVSLLAAANNEQLLYDISRWGEDVGIASKATFSRTKTRMEGAGLIETEKVPIDVGRPRLRLRLADERLQEADADELADIAVSMLAD
jgi:hypothetical protein